MIAQKPEIEKLDIFRKWEKNKNLKQRLKEEK